MVESLRGARGIRGAEVSAGMGWNEGDGGWGMGSRGVRVGEMFFVFLRVK